MSAIRLLALFLLACGGTSKDSQSSTTTGVTTGVGTTTGGTTTGVTTGTVTSRGIGAVCYHPNDCDSGICLFHPFYGSSSGYCSDTCQAAADCPSSYMYCCEWPIPFTGTATGTTIPTGPPDPWMCQPEYWLQPGQACDGITP